MTDEWESRPASQLFLYPILISRPGITFFFFFMGCNSSQWSPIGVPSLLTQGIHQETGEWGNIWQFPPCSSLHLKISSREPQHPRADFWGEGLQWKYLNIASFRSLLTNYFCQWQNASWIPLMAIVRYLDSTEPRWLRPGHASNDFIRNRPSQSSAEAQVTSSLWGL